MTTNLSAAAATSLPVSLAANTNAHAGDLGSLSDEQLVACAQNGDEAALEELLGRHEQKLVQLAKRFVPNDHDAQEVVQDVFLTTWRKLPGFEGRAQIGTWLHRVTVNAALMFLRARSRRPHILNAEGTAGDMLGFAGHPCFEGGAWAARTPDDHLRSAELNHELQKAVDELPAPLRDVFLERLVEGRSTRQTAQALGLSTLVVRTRLHRARLLLRANIADYRAA